MIRRKPPPTPVREFAEGPTAACVQIGREWFTILQANFIREFTVDFNATSAAIRAGATPRSASVRACQWMDIPKIRSAIMSEVSARHQRLSEKADENALYWKDMSEVDLTRNLDPVRFGACRHCHGVDHEYQFTLVEFRHAERRHKKGMLRLPEDKRVPFDEQGGSGYDFTAAPNDDCPECRGQGKVYLARIRWDNLSHAERMLFNGVKLYRDGSVEIKYLDRIHVRENFEVLTGIRKPMKKPLHSFDSDGMTEEQIDAFLEDAHEKRLWGPEDVKRMIDVTPGKGK